MFFGVICVLVVLLGIGVVILCLGVSLEDFIFSVGMLLGGFIFGEMMLVLCDVIKVMLVLVVGLGVVCIIKCWFDVELLFNIWLDVGMCMLMFILFGYVGGVLVVVMVLVILKVSL